MILLTKSKRLKRPLQGGNIIQSIQYFRNWHSFCKIFELHFKVWIWIQNQTKHNYLGRPDFQVWQHTLPWENLNIQLGLLKINYFFINCVSKIPSRINDAEGTTCYCQGRVYFLSGLVFALSRIRNLIVWASEITEVTKFTYWL